MLLAIDSSAGASAALLADGVVLKAWRTAETSTHAEVLATGVAEVLDAAPGEDRGAASLEGVVVGVGPGPFTGLRVGLALAHTLAEAWSLPLHGVCSLASPAHRAVTTGRITQGEFVVATDARRREVYWARFSAAESIAEMIGDPHVGPAAEVPALPVVGAGAGLYPELLAALGDDPGVTQWVPDAAEVGQLAARGDLALPALPLYLRDSDAKVPAQLRRTP